jgi:TfoX/Sxy family transcriptional regulator of competence genes
MAYDEDLADRIRGAVGNADGVTEKRMFGGLAFLVQGNMAVAAGSQGDVMLRVDPTHSEELIREAHVEPMVMRGREMAGWLRVGLEAVRTDAALQRWVDVGLAYARSLPPK